MQSIVSRWPALIASSLVSGATYSLAWPLASVTDVRDRLVLVVGRHVLDAHRRVGVPVNRASRPRGAPDVHLQEGRRLGIRLVVCVLADHADPIGDDAIGLMAAEAQLLLCS